MIRQWSYSHQAEALLKGRPLCLQLNWGGKEWIMRLDYSRRDGTLHQINPPDNYRQHKQLPSRQEVTVSADHIASVVDLLPPGVWSYQHIVCACSTCMWRCTCNTVWICWPHTQSEQCSFCLLQVRLWIVGCCADGAAGSTIPQCCSTEDVHTGGLISLCQVKWACLLILSPMAVCVFVGLSGW